MSRRRITAGGALVLVVVAGLLAHGVLPESAFADIAGDALYVGAVYLALVLVLPGLRPWLVGSISLAWSAGVELLQLTGVPHRLGELLPPLTLVLGTAFDARDLVVYAVAAALLTAIDGLSGRAMPAAPRER